MNEKLARIGFDHRDPKGTAINPFTGEEVETFPPKRTESLSMDAAIDIVCKVVTSIYAISDSEPIILSDQEDEDPDTWPEEFS